jgi:hypothetical protein
MNYTILPGGFKQFSQGPLDGRTYYKTLQEAFDDNKYEVNEVEEWDDELEDIVKKQVISTSRYIGQKFVIQKDDLTGKPAEYWFRDGLTDKDCVLYKSSEDGTGDTIPAFSKDVERYKDVVSINDYVRRQPEAPVYTNKEFTKIKDSLKIGEISQDGIYYVLEEKI